NEYDIAILTVNDDELWEGVPPLEFGSLPTLQDDVAVMGYPIRGDTISVTSGINNGSVELEASIMGGQKDGKKIKVPLNSSDKLFKETRDLNFEVVVQVLHQKAKSMKHDYSEMSTLILEFFYDSRVMDVVIHAVL
ncbi:hypothetical protein GIB67_003149, partial [Kingdonia uniflora]